MPQAWSTWLPDVMPHVPGCPVQLAEHEVKRAAQDFFQSSRAWQGLVGPLPVGAGQSTVTVTPAADTEIVRIESALLDGRALDPATVRALDDDHGDGWADRTGTPLAFVLLTPGVVRLFPAPVAAAASGLLLRASLKPAESATGLPDDLGVAYRTAVAVGARARLLAMPGKGWTNLDLAGAFGQAFASMADAAGVSANARGNTTARRSARVSWC